MCQRGPKDAGMCVQSRCSFSHSWMGGATGGGQEEVNVARKCESWSVRSVHRDFFVWLGAALMPTGKRRRS